MIAYRALFAREEDGGFVVTFPDFVHGVTQGDTEWEATTMAADLLGCLVADFLEASRELPSAVKHRGPKFREIRLPALQTARIELYRAFLASGIRKAELARRLGMSKGNIDRLFDLKHQSRLDQIEAAFAAVGKRLTVRVEEAA